MSKAASSFKIALQPKSGAMSAASSAVNTALFSVSKPSRGCTTYSNHSSHPRIPPSVMLVVEELSGLVSRERLQSSSTLT
jgi:hypothetical protein